MFHLVKTTNLIIKRSPLVCGILFAVLALLPISTQAQCANWDASGRLAIKQGGLSGFFIYLEQNGRFLTGDAQYLGATPSEGTKPITGTVEGTIDGGSFSVQIFWQNGRIGVYNANVLRSGRLEGDAYEKNTPSVRPTWYSDTLLKCPPPPIKSSASFILKDKPSKPKKIKSSGKMPKSEPAPTPPMKVPGIVASQVIFESVGAPVGFVFLTWDGGPDHPYAEIWFKVNGGDETFVVEQGKGERRVMVERGKLYEYILTDAGKTLANVSFIGPPF